MDRTQKLVAAAMLTALVTVATMAFQVPVPATKGYINLGDTVVFIAALILGARFGAIAGGVGSALADLLLGYAVWAPFTLVIKGLEGFIVGYIYYNLFRGDRSVKSRIAAMICGGLWMVAGYFGAEVLLYGAPAAFVELPGNFLQAGGSTLLALPVAEIMFRINLFKSLS